MIEWSVDLPNHRLISEYYFAIIDPWAESYGFSVKTVSCRTDTPEKLARADNLGSDKTIALAKSATAALQEYLNAQIARTDLPWLPKK